MKLSGGIALAAVAVLGLTLVAGAKDEAAPASQPTTAPTTQAAKGHTTASGLTIITLTKGHGDRVAKAGDTVTVHYVGKLENGKQFDASRDHGGPFTFPLGVGKVIAGWDEGVAGMKVGEKRKLIVPPDLGYGEQGAGMDEKGNKVIPPNATLIFEVELLKIQ